MERLLRTGLVGVMGVCAVLVVVAALAPAGASAAEPAWFECAKAVKVEGHYTGRYSNSSCTEENAKHEGKFEAAEGAETTIKGTGTTANIEMIGVGGFDCKSSAYSGKFTGAKSIGDIEFSFKGCGGVGNTETAGEIKLKPLRAELGYIEGGKAKHEVGIAFWPQEVGGDIADFKASPGERRWSGGFIGFVTSLKNGFTKELTLSFEDTAGVQKYKKLEGGPEYVLYTELGQGGEFGEPIQSAWSMELKTKTQAIELKA
jgi:hypothetical protein